MTEPPKPITRLAEPIDRTGPRRPNRLGRRSMIWANGIWALLAVVAWLLDGPVLAGGLAMCLLIVCGMYAVTVAVFAIRALMKAADRHLLRNCAAAALLLAVLGIVIAAWPTLLLLGGFTWNLAVLLSVLFVVNFIAENKRW